MNSLNSNTTNNQRNKNTTPEEPITSTVRKSIKMSKINLIILGRSLSQVNGIIKYYISKSYNIINNSIEYIEDSNQYSFILDNNNKHILVILTIMTKLNKDLIFNEVSNSHGVVLLYDKYALSGKEEDFFFQANEFFSFLSQKLPHGDMTYKIILDCKFDYEKYSSIDLKESKVDESDEISLRGKSTVKERDIESVCDERVSRIEEENVYEVNSEGEIKIFMEYLLRDFLNRSKMLELSKTSTKAKVDNCKSKSKCTIF